LVVIVVVVTTICASREEVTNVLRMSIIASGIATILQSLRETGREPGSSVIDSDLRN